MITVDRTLEKLKEERGVDARRRTEDPLNLQQSATADQKASGPLSVLGPDDPPPTRVVRMDRQVMLAAGMVSAESDRAMSAEQYRVIKQDLIRYCADASPLGPAPREFAMVTSAQPGDGKTFTSVNLALSMTSERDHDVLLIDGDVAKRHITRSFGLSDEPGLLDALREPKRKFSSVIYATDVPRLQLLPAGLWSEDATELLSSDRMRRFMSEIHLRHPRRLVVLDSSPALLLPDARMLASMVGQVVLVVKAGSTLQHDVKEAAAMIDSPACRVALVLNQMNSNYLLDSVVGYRYGYGYGNGYREQRGTDASDSASKR